MKHLEPQQQGPQPAPASPATKSWSRLNILIAVAATTAILGFGMSQFFGQPPTDHVSDSTKAELQENMARMHPLTPTRVPVADIQKTLDTMRLEPAAKRDLERIVTYRDKTNTEPTELALITLWDFAAEDGDIVEVSSGGYQIQVPLMNVPKEIAVPIDKSHAITLTGVRDGGGGITVAVMAGAQGTSLPPLVQGQTITLPTD
ncbi:MAG: hypothetical protein IPL70_17430 [Uliginosibacterium sp.]|jgi:hypothetical protein|nr:hypothetical protein [Uliginosibacterium sp.]